jgi:deoxycytidylate deaminase
MVLVKTPSNSPALRYLQMAANVSRSSDHTLHKMGAVIVRGGNVISVGCNKNRTHPMSKNYYRTIHAELDAMIAAGFVHGTYDGKMYVVRMTKGGAMATSKPCKDCWVLLKQAGILKVTFINGKGEIVSERV